MATILIADDEPAIRMLVAATLAGGDFEVSEAADGALALELVRTKRPALVLLDLSMPGMGGLDVCREIRADPDIAQTKVIILTGASSVDQEQAGMAAGADLFLGKPFSPLKLIEAVEEALR